MLRWLNTTMVVPGVAGGILGRYYTARGAIRIFARSARGNGSWLMVQNMRAVPGVVQKLTMTIP